MQKTKKLLYVIASLEGSGGSERALTTRVNYLLEKYNYDITIVTTNKNSIKSYYPLNSKIKLVNIPIDFRKNNLKNKLLSLFFNNHIEEKPLLEFIEKNKFDICSSFGAETFLYKQIEQHKFIKIKENRFTYKKLLSDEKLSFQKKIWRYFRFRNSVKVMQKMDYLITLTEEDAVFWKRYMKKVYVIPNFININSFEKAPLNNNSVIGVGRLEKEKDYHSLILAFKKVVEKKPDCTIRIFGEGSLRNDLEKLIRTLNLQDNIILKGATKDINKEYLKSSLFVMTSQYEGFPNSMLEAMAHGLPIVAFESVGGVKVLLENQKNGFLVKNRSIDDLAKGIITLIENEDLRIRMGEQSIQIAKQYSEKEIMERWHQFYRNCI